MNHITGYTRRLAPQRTGPNKRYTYKEGTTGDYSPLTDSSLRCAMYLLNAPDKVSVLL
jgi:hypothetical protein